MDILHSRQSVSFSKSPASDLGSFFNTRPARSAVYKHSAGSLRRSRFSSLVFGLGPLAFFLGPQLLGAKKGPARFVRSPSFSRRLLGAHFAFFLHRALSVSGAFTADPQHPISGGREIFAFMGSCRAYGCLSNFVFNKYLLFPPNPRGSW